MSPAALPQPEVETILPRVTFSPANSAEAVNAQVEAHHALKTMANRYLPEAIGALKGDNKTIIAKLDELLAGIADVQARVARLESGE